MRMIVLFDLAKKYNALVVGTENKSENLLSYFTRYGDQASDIEPIEHLYKTQVYQLANHLGVQEILLNQTPTAGLWQGQTDEGQFGFSYQEADQVLFLHLEKGLDVETIEQQGFTNARAILSWREKNLFKHNVPYVLEP
jgi:NAD+ synthase